jgi:hypothetical protein
VEGAGGVAADDANTTRQLLMFYHLGQLFGLQRILELDG